jgi:hypothetical protein
MEETRTSGASDASAQHEEVQQLLPSHLRGSSSPLHRVRLHDHDSRQLPGSAFEVDDSSRAFKPDRTVGGSPGSNDTGSSGSEADYTRAVLCLCGAHALARWGWRTWEFAVVSSWVLHQHCSCVSLLCLVAPTWLDFFKYTQIASSLSRRDSCCVTQPVW